MEHLSYLEDLMSCCNCGIVRPYDQDGHSEEYFCENCEGGQWCGCEMCASDPPRADRY